MFLPCVCHALAMFLPCRCRVFAMLLPCLCHVHAMCLPCSCHVLYMFSPCSCHALAMSLPCYRTEVECNLDSIGSSPMESSARFEIGPPCTYCGFAIARWHPLHCQCWRAVYCDRLCQRRDWRKHKATCIWCAIKDTTSLPLEMITLVCKFQKMAHGRGRQSEVFGQTGDVVKWQQMAANGTTTLLYRRR